MAVAGVQEVEIGVWVEGVQKWVTGVTRRTTCQDIIKALLRAIKDQPEPEVSHYVIVERWRKVERPLDHEQRILKVWRTWGEAVNEVRFSLRRVRDGESSVGRTERKRVRHRMRHQAYGGSKDSLINTTEKKSSSKGDPKYSETMERLMRLVVAQGETIQTQLHRLTERENQIENYEQQMHLLRVQRLGNDYLLQNYLMGDNSDPKDEPYSEEKSNDSGVVTEETVEASLSQALDGAEEAAAAAAASLEELRELSLILSHLEEVNSRLVHEEEALGGLASAVQAAREHHADEENNLRQELSRVGETHSELVGNSRHNEQRLRETDTALWQRRKLLDSLIQEERESDMETAALRKHLDYIIHLPPTAFRLPPEESDDAISSNPIPPQSKSKDPLTVYPVTTHTMATSFRDPPSVSIAPKPTDNQRVPPITNLSSFHHTPGEPTSKLKPIEATTVPPPVSNAGHLNLSNTNSLSNSVELARQQLNIPSSQVLSIKGNLKKTVNFIPSSTNLKSRLIIAEEEDDEIPPPLPTCPPPQLDNNKDLKHIEDDDDDVDSANNSSLCVSSRSSTSSETSTGIPNSCTKSLSRSNSKRSHAPGGLSNTKVGELKDTDSTGSNSDTGLSSLHSSSDDGGYVLDTLV